MVTKKQPLVVCRPLDGATEIRHSVVRKYKHGNPSLVVHSTHFVRSRSTPFARSGQAGLPSVVGRLRPAACDLQSATHGLRPAIVYIGIGSNMGDRLKNIEKAITLMAEHVKIVKKSCIYETEPVGGIKQGWFLNCVVKISSTIPPFRLFRLLKSIEKIIGRKKEVKWGPRIIDLDILLYNNEIIKEKILKIPHPEMHRRGFVLIPMKDIYPGFIHPVFKKTILELLESLKLRTSQVHRWRRKAVK